MKNKDNDIMKAGEMEEFIESIRQMLEAQNSVQEQVIARLTPIANRVIYGEIVDESKIAHILDEMLDHCDHADMLTLFKRVCRAIFEKHPTLVRDYIYAYKHLYEYET
ncbi:MAG: hypothetical protein FWH03_00580 [Firmicutes bacterium]|nr:hypothetical protein [Bacillota bacterium]